MLLLMKIGIQGEQGEMTVYMYVYRMFVYNVCAHVCMFANVCVYVCMCV